jgi:antitoxin component YwqK of YwqJK toxin-antitoxin module
MRNIARQIVFLHFIVLIWGCSRTLEIVYSKYDNGQVHEILILDNPVTADSIGIKKIFYENGDIKCTGGYKGGQRHGEWTCYYPNREIEWRSTYKDGLENGETFCNHLNGTWRKMNVRNGKKEGKTIEYNLDTLNNFYFYIYGQYKNEKEDGLWLKKDTNNTILIEMTFKDGKRLGYFANYYPNGNIRIKGNFIEGGQTQNVEYFDENGNRQELEDYDIYSI